ncbi:MAG: EFR1 family ferrodoxin [Spirochaetales bacterium]|nr:EFR1 family ferrodoxin [Spirochaetales bacterium]
MSTTMYYFSGTGNSFFVAKELKKAFSGAELIPVVQAIQSDLVVTAADTVGFVFPCHGLTIPIPVKILMKKLDATSSDYFFATATRGGSVFRGFSIIDKALRKQGKKLNASFIINMALNDPKLSAFDVPSKEDLQALEEQAVQKIQDIKEIVEQRTTHHDDTAGVTFSTSNLLNWFLERLIPFMTHFISPAVKKYFYIDDKCTGCGTCEKVCPTQKLKMADNKPVWQRNVDCYLCYACLNFCPSKAIQIYSKVWMKSYTTERGRYPHPYVSLKDMAKQKNS